MYKCPNCGGEMDFLPENGKIKCQYCGSVFSPDDDLSKERKSAEEQKDPGSAEAFNSSDGIVYTCSQCGASLYTTAETGVTFCSFCGSQAFLESRIKGKENILPELIVPFKISKEQCGEIYKNKIRGAWFLPSAMKSDTTVDKFRGIYMPCWVYTGEGLAEGIYKSDHVRHEGSYDYIESYETTVTARGEYEGFVEDSSSSFPDSIMREIEPFSMKNAVSFNDKYMTGFYADIGNVPSETYNKDVYEAIDISLRSELAKCRELKKKGIVTGDINNSTAVKANITRVQKGFIPVWFLSNRNERTGLMSYAVINGITGKIHSDLPIDMKKYLLLSLLIAVPIFILLQFFTIKPGFLLVLTMLLLGVMMFISTKMIGDAYIQEKGLDDPGLLYLKDKKIAPAGNAEIRNENPPRIKKKHRFGNVPAGIMCFVGIPFLASVISVLLDVNIIILGFIVGIVLYGILKTRLSEKSDDNEEYKVGKKKIRLPIHMVLRAIGMPLIGILAGLLIMIWNPAHDMYYYLAAVLCCVLLILTVLDFTKSTNRLSLRRPAQLQKRGGDEND